MSELIFVISPEQPQMQTTNAVVRVAEEVPLVAENVVIRPYVPPPTAHLAVAEDAWTWRELRDYVVGEIEKVTGVFPRNEMKEMGIFKSFLTRWPDDAADIARYAFGPMQGYWKGAPVSVNRFCRASDPYFARLIVDHLNQHVRA